jgi:hypothetical protein
VWAVAIAQPILWFAWLLLPRNTGLDVAKLVLFVGVLASWAGRPTSGACRGRVPSCRASGRRSTDPRLMPRDIDALTSFTLKHLRDRWWDASFTAFLQDALLPQAGERVLDVGCGAGTAELILSALQPGGAHFVGIDLLHARCATRAGDARAGRRRGAGAADAARLPFAPPASTPRSRWRSSSTCPSRGW